MGKEAKMIKIEAWGARLGVYAWENINSISDVILDSIKETHLTLIPIEEGL